MIGSKLRSLRIRFHMSQTELARRLSVHPKSIKNWENDISDPTLENLRLICMTFHVSANEFLGIEPVEQLSLVALSREERRKIIAMVQAYLSACNESESD